MSIYAYTWLQIALYVSENTPFAHICIGPKRGLEQNKFQVAKYIRYICLNKIKVMIILLVIYWITTTIYGAYWLVKNPSIMGYDDSEYFTLLEVIAKIFPAMLIAWLVVPMFLLNKIKFKR
jgi:hypothetical protein